MAYELGLCLTIAVSGWIALDPVFSAGSRRRFAAIAALAAAAGVWAAGELMLVQAAGPAEEHFARRVVYLGACFIGVTWLWSAAQAARPRWWRRAPWVLGPAALLSLFFYASVYWGGAWFVDWEVDPPRRGPLFLAHMLYAWALIGLGVLYFVQSALRLHRAHPLRIAVLVLGPLAPLIGNALYLNGMLGSTDPTPILLGLSGLAIRPAVVSAGLAAYVPLDHSDIVEQLEAGVVVANLAGEVTAANRAARELLSRTGLVGCGLDELLVRIERLPDRAVEVRRFPLHSRLGPVGSCAVLTDRTVSERSERRLQLAARLESLGFLTAGIAHEVNNPLAFIRANLSQLEKLAWYAADENLRSGLPDPVAELAAEAPEIVAETQEGIERIAQLAERLRTFARDEPQATQVRSLDLAVVAQKAVAMARAGRPPQSITTRVDPAPPVQGSEGQVVQIVLNLLVNAIQASGETPEIELQVGPSEDGVALRVLDRGSGIAADAMRHIFDPFFTTKPTGTGLGLSLSYDLARQLGGRLEAAERPGGGAAFTLWLPAAE